MHVQLTIELVSKVLEHLCTMNNMNISKKDAKKVFAAVVGDDEVEKYYFCGARCKSKRACMREVPGEGHRCHVHDPERKCKGVTKKGKACNSVVKKDLEYCWQHESSTRAASGQSVMIFQSTASLQRRTMFVTVLFATLLHLVIEASTPLHMKISTFHYHNRPLWQL